MQNSEQTVCMRKKRFTAYILLYNFIGLTVAGCGWLWEVLLFLIKEKQFVNRGFLYGPWLPVYGAGAVLLSALFYAKNISVIITYGHFGSSVYPKEFYDGKLYAQLKMLLYQIHRRKSAQKKKTGFPAITDYAKAKNKQTVSLKRRIKNYGNIFNQPKETGNTKNIREKNPNKRFFKDRRNDAGIFLICMIGGCLTEFVSGWCLWHVFHKKYWDYSGYFLNLGGYICFFSALGFGTFGLIWIKIIGPYLIRIWENIQFKFQFLIIGLLDILFITDTVFSLMQPNTGKNITFSFFLNAAFFAYISNLTLYII